MKHVLLIISCIIFSHRAIYADVEHTFTISFSLDDFNITYNDNLVSVEPKLLAYTYPDDPLAPALPFKTIEVINDYSMKTSFVTPQFELKQIASCVQINAMGTPQTSNEVSNSNETSPIASQSQIRAVELVNNYSIQNGVSFATISANPFLYDYDTRTLYFISNLTITVTQTRVEGFNPTNTIIRVDRFNANGRLNQEALAMYHQHELSARPLGETTNDQFDYLIITADSLVCAFNELVRWKNQKGIRTRIVSTTEIFNSPGEYIRPEDKIKTYIKDCYNDHGIKYVLLGGNSSIIPAVYVYHPLHLLERLVPSDLYYGCFDNDFYWDANGNGILGERHDNLDLEPEVIISRFPVKDNNGVTTLVKKILFYEKTPPQTDFVMTMGLAGTKLHNYDETQNKCDAQIYSDNNYNSMVKPYWPGNVINVFYDGQNSDYSFTKENLIKLLNGDFHNNDGPHIVYIGTHGGFNCWECFNPDPGYSLYTHNTVSDQVNINPTIILTSACHTNCFDKIDNNCLSTYFLIAKFGALAYIGSTREGYSDSSRAYENFFYNNLFNKDINGYTTNIGYLHQTAIHEAFSGKYNVYGGCSRYSACSITLMGDPETPIYTEDPAELNELIKIDKTETEYKVSIINDDTEDLSITISDGKIIPTYFYHYQNKTEISIPILDEIFILTVSGRNKIPYIYEPTTFSNLFIHDRDIDISKEYWADNVIIGSNVTVKSGVKLIIHAKNSIKMLDNVKAEEGATIQIGFN